MLRQPTLDLALRMAVVRRFQRGESIVWRSVDRTEGVVSTVWPWTIVDDEPDRIVLYLPVGTIGKQRTGERGGPRDRLMVKWDGGHTDVTWHTTNIVRLYREGDDFSIWIARDDTTGSVVWRYVNLEEPWRRTPIGFDSRDHWLDLWSEPESDVWIWKDEDELEWLVQKGHVDAAYASRVRASGERAIRQIQTGETLLESSWSTWRADDAWQRPVIPPNWGELDPGG